MVAAVAINLGGRGGSSTHVAVGLPSNNAAATRRTSQITLPGATTPGADATSSTTVPAAPTTTLAPAPDPTVPAPTAVAPTTLPRPTATTTAPRTVIAPATRAPLLTIPPVVSALLGGGNPHDFVLIGYRWNPCQVVTVTSTGPDISGIVSELASITGLHLQMVTGNADITVQWGAVPPGGEIGLTAWRAVGRWLIQAGINISPQAQPYLATVLRHELGHAMGLGHASQSSEVMYPTIGRGSPTDYSAGDLAGLRAVGASAGC